MKLIDIFEANFTHIEPKELIGFRKGVQSLIDDIDKGIVPPEASQEHFVSRDYRTLQFLIDNGIKPSEKVQIAAVGFSHDALNVLMDNNIKPSKAVQIAAVARFPEEVFNNFYKERAIDMPKPVEIAMIKADPELLIDIDACEDAKIAGVHKYGHAISYLKDPPSEAVQIAAVTATSSYKGAYYSIIGPQSRFPAITDPSYNVRRAALLKYPPNIKYMMKSPIDFFEKLSKDPDVIQRKQLYDTIIKNIYPNNNLLIKKWIRYGDTMREEL